MGYMETGFGFGAKLFGDVYLAGTFSAISYDEFDNLLKGLVCRGRGETFGGSHFIILRHLENPASALGGAF